MAERLYASENFFLARRYAEANYNRWFIFSAKHGLIDPGKILEPYDLQIADLPESSRDELVRKVKLQVAHLRIGSAAVSLCNPDYNQILEAAGLRLAEAPFRSESKEEKLTALKTLTDPNSSELVLESCYDLIDILIKARGLVPLRELMKEKMPDAGIYLFFDTKESRLASSEALRVVRVGTHGVAAGSKATLRHRMRTHLGTAGGGGNHRSSIFRLHVGRSMILSGSTKPVPTWASARLPDDNASRRAEADLEARVSEYLGDLMATTLNIPGDPSKDNDRAYLEQNLIALLSNNYKPLDPASHAWLGRCSDRREIARSALWNVNHTAQQHDPFFVEMLNYYVNFTLGRKAGRKPVCPPNWLSSVRGDARQLALFGSHGT